MLNLEGIMTALITPFDGGVVDTLALTALVRGQLEAGIHGLVPCGTTGETPTLSDEEYATVVGTVLEAAGGRVPVLAGTGTNCTRTTVERTIKARRLGVDAALVVAPYYNKPQQRGIIEHYSTVAREGGLPVVVYNVPSRTGVNIAPATSIALSKVEGIVAVKEASGSVEAVVEIVNSMPDGFTVLSGDDGLSLRFFEAGARGAISVASNVAPGQLVDLWNHWKAGDKDESARVDRSLSALYTALFVEPSPVPCKAAALMLGLISADMVRLPLMKATDETRETVRKALQAAGVL